MDDRVQFDLPASPKIIKVIGVGGGGGNAVNHMYREGIHEVTFVVCNTDRKALEESPVPVKLQLGHEGLGAGNRPGKAKEATESTTVHAWCLSRPEWEEVPEREQHPP